ncbi:PRA1 family protein H [Cornus florida]|uniref:PRA1 family protein H n=1 Tax=Cornus florida TaxID=4283 RepID=UPI00289D52F2|nr:PRA1 family protein H [Cornus florida]
MVFSSNPLSLSVPEPAFESWLRDSGYLEILDERTSDLHRLTSATTAAAASDHRNSTTASTNSATPIANGFFRSVFSYLATILSLFTLNPFAKLTADDFSGETPSWTLGFIGFCDSYSFPSSPSQARLRVHENVKRYARNYASLFILFFACSLYQMPLALVGLISSLALWDLFRFCAERWGLDQYPVTQQSLVRIAQCATAIILFCFNVQMALFCALGVSYAGMLLHASFRKLTPAKQPTRGRGK